MTIGGQDPITADGDAQGWPAVEHHSTRQGIALLIGAAVLWSANGILIKSLSAANVSPWTIACGRSLIAALFLTPWALRERRTIVLDRWLLGAVLMFTGMTLTFVTATTMTSAANAIILQYTAPAWVFLLSPWLLGERSQPRQWLALAVAMAGVAYIFVAQYRGDAGGLWVALTSGLVFGVQSVLFRRVRTVGPFALAWLTCLGSGLLLSPGLLAAAGQDLTARAFVLLAVMGVVQFGVPYVLYSAGLQRVRAQQAILIVLLEPVLNPIWPWLAGIEAPAGSTLIGGAIILSAIACLSLSPPPRRAAPVQDS